MSPAQAMEPFGFPRSEILGSTTSTLLLTPPWTRMCFSSTRVSSGRMPCWASVSFANALAGRAASVSSKPSTRPFSWRLLLNTSEAMYTATSEINHLKTYLLSIRNRANPHRCRFFRLEPRDDRRASCQGQVCVLLHQRGHRRILARRRRLFPLLRGGECLGRLWGREIRRHHQRGLLVVAAPNDLESGHA